MFIPVNRYRTDWCNPYTGAIEFRQCHDPERNVTIDANAEVEQIRDGKKYRVKCEEQGPLAVIFTEKLVEDEVAPTPVPGICSDGSKMYVPNMEWGEGRYVRRCNPETSRVETIACRTDNGTLIPKGSNITDEHTNESGAHEVIVYMCVASGDSAEFIEITSVRQMYEKKEKPFVCGTGMETYCHPVVNGTYLYNIRIEAGEELVLDGNIVHACVDDGVHTNHDEVIGCVSLFGNFMVIGENITEQYKPEGFSTAERFTSYCLADGERDAVTFYQKEKAGAGFVFPERDVLECAPGKSNGDEYVDGDLIKLCRFNHRGKFNNSVVTCLVINNEGKTEGQVDVNKPKRLDGVLMRCSEDETGRYVITPVPKCTNGKMLDEEWVLSSIVFSCVEHKRNQFQQKMIGCVSHYGNFLNIGENVTEGEIIGEVYDSFCSSVEGGAALRSKTRSDTVIPGQPPQPAYPKRQIPYCGSNPEDRSGYKFKEDDVIYFCDIDHRGRENITVVGCSTSTFDHVGLALGEVAVVNGTEMRCNPTKGGSAVLSPVKVVAGKCANGKKIGEEWRSTNFTKTCVSNGNANIVVVKACVSEGIEFLVGQNKTFKSVTCSCTQVLDKTPGPVRIAKIKCTRNRKVSSTSTVAPTQSTITTTSNSCGNGKLVNEEWVLNGLVYACVDKIHNIHSQIIGCVSKYGNFIQISENVTETHKGNSYNSFCLAVEGGAKLEIEELKKDGPGNVYAVRKVNTCILAEEYPKPYIILVNGEFHIRDNFIFKCQIDHRSRETFKRQCWANDAIIPFGKTALLANGTKRCEEAADGHSKWVDVKCKNGRKMGEEWEEKHIVISCEKTNNGLDAVKGEVIVGLVVKACVTEGVRIPVGEKKEVNSANCECTRNDGVNKAVKALSAKLSCSMSGPGETRTAAPTTVATTTTTIPKTTELDCSIEDNLNKEWVVNGLIYSCVKSPESVSKIVSEIIGCVSRYGNFVNLTENVTETHRDVSFNSLCHATKEGVRLEIQQVKKGDAIPDTYNRRDVLECDTEKHLAHGDMTSDPANREAQLVCRVDHRGHTSFQVEGCYGRRGPIKFGEEVVMDEFGADRRICKLGADGNVFLERVEIEYKCNNGKKMDEEWEETDFVKACEDDGVTMDGIETMIVIKACVVKGIKIPVGERRVVASESCACVRPVGSHPRLKADAAHPVCLPLNEEKDTRTTTPLDCSIPGNLNKQWIDVIGARACTEIKKIDGNGTEILDVAVSCFIAGGEINVKVGLSKNFDHWVCTRKDRTEVLLTHEFSYHCRNGMPIDIEWFESLKYQICKVFVEGGKSVPRIVTLACNNGRQKRINVGEQFDDGAGKVYHCTRVGEYDAALSEKEYAVEPVPKCDNGLLLNHDKIENGVAITCHKDGDKLISIAWKCVAKGVREVEQGIMIGETVRQNGTQYSCEKRGETGAELVVQSFRQLCERGDETVNAWVDNEVLRDCVRSGKKHIVHARLCILPDDRIIEIGQNITEEFETFLCEREGEFDAKLVKDQSKIHKDYFTTPDTCKNGKKLKDTWLEHSVIRRACRSRKGRPTVVDLGCLTDDGRLIAVGKEATWEVPATADETALTRTMYCKAGEKGFGITVELAELGLGPSVSFPRSCDNGKVEGALWEYGNVLRNCTEVDDAMVVVALRCVFGNDTMAIGELRHESEFVSVECARLGEHDAVVMIDFIPAYEKVCENGKKVDEEWSDSQGRYVCRIRNRRATVVPIGCVLEDGTILAFGQSHTETVQQPGYEEHFSTRCNVGEDGSIVMTGGTARSQDRHDEKSPCGERKYGDVWASGRFLKKCKVIGDNLLSAVTIGCVTTHDTHMLEGQYLVEDDVDIKCSRNLDGKLELRYAYSVIEE